YKIVKKIRRPVPINENVNYLIPHVNIVLHGSAIIFSPSYLDKEENAFHPGTFMYAEEDILYHTCMRKGYKIIYSPLTSIFHKEDASTDSILKSDYRKLMFIYKNQRDSFGILKKILENIEKR
ncbi:glycosyltransferase family 2 protein, partial [Paenibacillus sp. NPDC056579]|uniref:glycosyltransferase family 2 protein n=1 Tax=Paenibacillus sp. NPDC056579 TaxID=3345871 RepID=UPI003678DDBF